MKSNHTGSGILHNKRLLLLTLLLTVIAALPRLYNLGELGFYMDEETTAFASRSLADAKHPQMPSGMPYHRAVLHSWINAQSAKLFGVDREFSYRLPAAIFGVLTIPLMFLSARHYVGTSAAFLAALLLALSEWHVITSRQARMYAPFLFFYIASVFSILRWIQSDDNRHLLIAMALFGVSASLHQFGLFAAFIPLAALLIQDFSRTPTWKLLLFTAVSGVSALLYGHFYIDTVYQAWKTTNGIELANSVAVKTISGFPALTLSLLVAGAIGALLGIWLARLSVSNGKGNGRYLRNISLYGLAVLFAILAVTANLHGAFLSALLFLFIHPGRPGDILKTAYKPILVITATSILSAGLVISRTGPVPALKTMASLPHQYWTLLIDLSPGITLLFLVALLYLALGNRQSVGKQVYVLALCALIPLILIGIIKNWVPARYIITAYPFILILAGFLLHRVLKYGLSFSGIHTETPIMASCLLVILSGILGGHGLVSTYRAATVTYGEPVNQTAYIFPVHPDHKHPGEFVAAHSSSDDIIIAEDVIQQRWYAGRVDYWLRDQESHKKFIFIGDDGQLRDIYVNSTIATPEILDTLLADKEKRLWLITSGETFDVRHHYLNKQQLAWLEKIERLHKPVYTGKDRISFVYCLNCKNSF